MTLFEKSGKTAVATDFLAFQQRIAPDQCMAYFSDRWTISDLHPDWLSLVCLQVPLTDKEVSTITSILQASHGMRKSQTGNFQSYSHSFQGNNIQDLVGQLTARALAGMEGIDYNRHFQDMMNRLEYAFFPEQSVEEQMNDMMERYNLPRMGGQPDALKVSE